MDLGALTAVLVCIHMDQEPEPELRLRLQGPLGITPLPVNGESPVTGDPIRIFTSPDLALVLQTGLDLMQQATASDRRVVALHLSPAHPASKDLAARNAVAVALTGGSPCFLVSDSAAYSVRRALPSGYRLRSIGVHRRKDLAPPEELFLLEPAGDEERVPNLRVLSASAKSLPVFHTPFMGRHAELRDLLAAVRQNQLITVTGACGIGKSRLAIQLAAALAGEFAQGVQYHDLSSITPQATSGSPGSDRIALAFGARLAGALQGQQLVVLDNAEQVLQPLRDVVRDLLETNPHLKLLCTSQAPLGLQAEERVQLTPLALAPREGENLSEAACLFMAQAHSSTQVDPVQVNALCSAVDGVPLAIELAAELVDVVPLDQLSKRLQADLTLLSSKTADMPVRHRSLTAAIAQSYQLVRPQAQRLLHRLSVFHRDFSLQDAEAVCSDDSLPASQVLPLLLEVSSRSLVEVRQQSGGPIYRLLATTRLYGRSCLEADGETEMIWDRHRDRFLQVAEQASPSRAPTIVEQVDAAYPDMRRALQRCLDQGDGERAQRFCTALAFYWSRRGKTAEGFALSQQALALPSASTIHRLRTLERAGGLAADLGDLAAGEAMLRQAVTQRRELANGPELVPALTNLGVVLRRLGRYDDAEATYREALALQERLGSQEPLILLHLNLGVVLGSRGDRPGATVEFQLALEVARRLGDQWGVATSLSQLAHAAIADNRLDDANEYLTEALVLFRGRGDKPGAAVTLQALGEVHQSLGQHDKALAYLRECMATAVSIRRMGTLLDSMDLLISSLIELKQAEVVARLLGFCQATRERESFKRSPSTVKTIERITETATAALGGTWFGALYRAGSLMTLEQAVEIATTSGPPILPTPQQEAAPASDPPPLEGTDELSAREVQILRLLVQGLTSREIGERVYLSPRTVEKHLERMRQRLNVPNKARLVAWALQQGYGGSGAG